MPTDSSPPHPSDEKAFNAWLKAKTSEFRAAIYLRETLRLLPVEYEGHEMLLPILRALSAARYALLNPNATKIARDAAGEISQRWREPIVYLAFVTASLTGQFVPRGKPKPAYFDLDRKNLASGVSHQYEWIHWDASQLAEKVPLEVVVRAPLWPRMNVEQPSTSEITARTPWTTHQRWRELADQLKKNNSGWEVWIDWYEYLLEGSRPSNRRSNAWERAYLDPLPWKEVKSTNAEILARLNAAPPEDLLPIEGIDAPIDIVQLPDGRIAVDPAVNVPQPTFTESHANALAACRSLAKDLHLAAGNEQLGKPYAVALKAYLKWLPASRTKGNIVLADSEVRILTRLFKANTGELDDVFAARLSVFLENHIGLRVYYPELQRFYEAIVASRIRRPLEPDAVAGLRNAIRENSEVFDKSVSEAIDEVARPLPGPEPTRAEDLPARRQDQEYPTPPADPQGNVDQSKARDFVLATTANRIWKFVLEGKDIPKAIEGWHKAYEQIKPYMEHILSWLKIFLSGGGGMPPSLPPTIPT